MTPGDPGARGAGIPDVKTREQYDHWYQPAPDGGKPDRFRSQAGLVQRCEEGGETGESCPMIAAYITSLARCKLWQLIQAAGDKHNFKVGES
jgi:hypothetical protein